MERVVFGVCGVRNIVGKGKVVGPLRKSVVRKERMKERWW